MSAFRVAVGSEETRAVLEPATSGPAKALFVCAHGAGSHMDHASMLRLSEVLRAHGLDVVRFNFLYREKGSRRPDPMPRLQSCLSSVVEEARRLKNPQHLLIGGRSMGGRAAAMLAADGFACQGLLLFAYPLHPAGKPEKLRAEHLARIRVPVLCVNGTRDALCRRDLMERTLEKLSGWQMHWLEGKDHAFLADPALGAAVERWLEFGVGARISGAAPR